MDNDTYIDTNRSSISKVFKYKQKIYNLWTQGGFEKWFYIKQWGLL